ncbi:MAG: sigma 54-interacting transcriptional regulator [Planctomycetota bacterium]
MDSQSQRIDSRVLVCTADASVEDAFADVFTSHGIRVQVVTSHEQYLQVTARESFDAVLVDLPLRADSNSVWRERLLEDRLDAGNVVVAVPAEREEDAIQAVERGAAAFVTKPCSARQTAASLALVAENRRLARRLKALEHRAKIEEAPKDLVGCSAGVRRLSAAITRAGMNDATVLIEGQPGSGKSFLAQLIHEKGRRADKGFVALNCDGVDDVEVEGAIERAQEGTLLLEDVDKLPARAQSRLVRHLKESSGSEERSVRILATTCSKLAEQTARGTFREDLYYRLNMFPIVVPTLAERREDIPLLAKEFLARSAMREGLPERGFTPGAMILLEAHPWPGNVAQLEQSVARAHQVADGGTIDRVHLFGSSTGMNPPPDVQGFTDKLPEQEDEELTEDDILPFQEEEKRLLGRALQATKGNVRRAAQLLGIGRATLYRKIQIYKLRLQ